MNSRRRRRANPLLSLLIAVCACASGCGYHVFSPPARGLPFDSAATLPPGKTGVAIEGGQAGELFGPDIFAIGGRVRHGLREGVDGVVEANIARVLGDSDADTHRNLYSVRAGTKLRPWKFLAFTAGLGGGGSAGGGFISPDIGVVLALENPYFVPLVGARGMFSQPIGARSVDLGSDDSDDDDREARYRSTPIGTWGTTVYAGARIPLEHVNSPATAFTVTASWTELGDSDTHAGFSGFGASFELVL
jgi:hypothetical protein